MEEGGEKKNIQDTDGCAAISFQDVLLCLRSPDSDKMGPRRRPVLKPTANHLYPFKDLFIGYES